MKLTPNTYLNMLNEYSKVLSEVRVTPTNMNLTQRYWRIINNYSIIRTYFRNQGVI